MWGGWSATPLCATPSAWSGHGLSPRLPDHRFDPYVGLPSNPPSVRPLQNFDSLISHSCIDLPVLSDTEDDISSRMFSGILYLQDNLGSETSYYDGISSMSLLNTSVI